MTKQIRDTLDKMHANHQLRKVTTMICDEIDKGKAEREEADERLRKLEDGK